MNLASEDVHNYVSDLEVTLRFKVTLLGKDVHKNIFKPISMLMPNINGKKSDIYKKSMSVTSKFTSRSHYRVRMSTSKPLALYLLSCLR